MIISIINQKGGVAKTTSTFNLGSILAKQGKKVLLIDIDPQNSLTTSFNLLSEKSMFDVMCNDENIKNIILKVSENLFLAPSNLDLSVAELQLINVMARENVLKKNLNKIENDFDIILIDCPPSLSLLTINSLVASDEVIVPVATDFLSYKGLELLLDTIEKVKNNLNENLAIKGVIATMYDGRTNHSNEVLKVLKNDFTVLGVIKSSVIVKDSIMANEPLITFAPNHETTKEYLKIAKEIK